MAHTKLRRSSTEKMILGVAGGLADYFSIDPVLARLGFVILTLAGGSGVLIYIVLAIIMPPADATATTTDAAVQENLARLGSEAAALGERVAESLRTATEQRTASRQDRHVLIGVVLLLLGTIFLLENLGIFSWFRWSVFWPLVLIILGIALMSGRFKAS